MIDQELRQFIEGPVILNLASVGEGRRMAIGRAAWVRVADSARVDLLVSRWQWPATIDNLLRNPAMAFTASSPVTYTSFQLKGRATLRPALDSETALADRAIAATHALLNSMGMVSDTRSGWLSNRDLWAVTLAVGDVFIQTPGSLAGQRRPAP